MPAATPKHPLEAVLGELERQQKQAENVVKARLLDDLATVKRFHQAADLLLRASLLAAGFHQHDRGQWREKRTRNGR